MAFWIRVNARLSDDAEVRAFARSLFPALPTWQSVPLACGLLVALWGRVVDEQEDGNLADRDDDALEEWAKWRGEPGLFAKLFRAVFTLDGKIREWEDYQGPLIDRRRRDRDRIAERRAEARRRRDAVADITADSRADVGATVRTSHAPTLASVGATSQDVDEMSTSNENENGNEEIQRTHNTPREVLTRSVAETELRTLLTDLEMADVEDFLSTRPAATWPRWYREMLKFIGPATGALPADLANACSDALLVNPRVDSPIGLSAFVVKRMQLRRTPPQDRPPRTNGRGPRGPYAPAPTGYDTSANDAAERRLTRGDDQ